MMATRKYKDGNVTVTLDGSLEKFVVDAARAAGGGALEVMEAAAEQQAAESRLAWYQHVTRKTGLSGDIQATTTISQNKITVSVGSTDPRKVNFKGIAAKKQAAFKAGLPAPTGFEGKETRLVSFIHEPGPLSTILVAVSAETYWKTPESMRGPARALFVRENGEKEWIDLISSAQSDGSVAGQYLVRRPNPEASGGRRLIQLLVRTPTKKLAIKLAPKIAEEIANRMSHG